MLPENLTTLVPFKGISADAAAQICDTLSAVTFDDNETILHEGDDTQALWIILSGECIVSRSCPSDEKILAVLNAGDVFGEMSFLQTSPHSASVIAAKPVKACCYHRKDFDTLSRERPEAAFRIAVNIAGVIAERLRQMDTWVCDLFETPNGNDHRDEWQRFRAAMYTNWDF